MYPQTYLRSLSSTAGYVPGWSGATAAISWPRPPRSFETSWRIGWARVRVGQDADIMIVSRKVAPPGGAEPSTDRSDPAV